MRSGTAVITACGRYRYRLERRWEHGPAATFVMLNPSTADHQQDDPTIRRCIGYERAWHLAGIVVVNLYAWRATRPADLWAVSDPVGPDNDETLAVTAAAARNAESPIVAAWGAHARPDRIAAVTALPHMDRLTALALTNSGQPRHPLYLPRTLTPVPWSPPSAAA